MPLDSNAPNYAAQEIGLMKDSPSYVAPSLDEFVDPAKVLANEHAGLENGALFADTSLRGAAFQLQKQEADRRMQFNDLMQPLLVSSQQAQNTLLTHAVTQQQGAWQQLPDYTSRINALDPSDPQFGVKVASVMGEASSNPALFQSLQGSLAQAQAKKSAYDGSMIAKAKASIEPDVSMGIPGAQQTWSKVQQMQANGSDGPTILGTIASYNNQKAVAARAQFQIQNAALGPYAITEPPLQARGIWDQAEQDQVQKNIAEAQKQKNQGTTYQSLADTKGATALQLQDLKNQGRIDYAVQRFGTTPVAQSGRGKVLSQTATSLLGQIKAATDPAVKARLQGQLDGVTSEMEQLAGVPAATTSSASELSDGQQHALFGLNKSIDTLQGLIANGHDDLDGAKLQPSVVDPVKFSGGFAGLGQHSNVPENVTPNQFRLQQLIAMRNALVPPSPSAQAPGIGIPPAVAPAKTAPTPSAPAAPTQSLTPQTDDIVREFQLPTTFSKSLASASTPGPQPSPSDAPSTASSLAANDQTMKATMAKGASKTNTAPPELPPNLQQAVDWARAHPSDPRSPAIIAKVKTYLNH